MTNNIKAPMGLWSAPITVSIVWIICIIISAVRQLRGVGVAAAMEGKLPATIGKKIFQGLTIPFFTIFITIIFIINAQKRKFDQVEKEKPDEAEKAKQYNKRNKVRRIVLISVVSIIGWMLLGFFPIGFIMSSKNINNLFAVAAEGRDGEPLPLRSRFALRILAGFNAMNPFTLTANSIITPDPGKGKNEKYFRYAMFLFAFAALLIGIGFSLAWMSESDPLDDESDGTAVPSGTSTSAPSTSAPFGSEEIDDAAKFFKADDYAAVWGISIFLVIYFIFIIGLPGLNRGVAHTLTEDYVEIGNWDENQEASDPLLPPAAAAATTATDRATRLNRAKDERNVRTGVHGGRAFAIYTTDPNGDYDPAVVRQPRRRVQSSYAPGGATPQGQRRRKPVAHQEQLAARSKEGTLRGAPTIQLK